MGWSEASLRTLILPQTAGTDDPQILIGPDLPPELAAENFIAAIVFRFDATKYAFIGLYDEVTNMVMARGTVDETAVPPVVYLENMRQDSLTWGNEGTFFFEYAPFPSLSEEVFRFQNEVGNARVDFANNTFVEGDLRVRLIDKAVLTVEGDQIVGGFKAINGQAVTAGTDTTTSATYVNLAGTGATTSISFPKRFDATALEVVMSPVFWANGASSGARFGARINGTDYDICQVAPPASARTGVSGVRKVAAGLAAGTYTVQARWLRYTGAGTLTRDTLDWFSMSVREVDPA